MEGVEDDKEHSGARKKLDLGPFERPRLPIWIRVIQPLKLIRTWRHFFRLQVTLIRVTVQSRGE
jgi:hypothetical protein